MDSSPLGLDAEFMALALDQARNALAREEVPVGAVITKDDKVLAQDHNRRENLHDATAHAEILVMRQLAHDRLVHGPVLPIRIVA